MRRRSVVAGLTLGPSLASQPVSARTPRRSTLSVPVLSSLAMPVTVAENRQYSYTDKVSGYFHGRTHTDENPDWFNGWNIATKRIFHDYRLSVDGVALSRAQAQAVVSPHILGRAFTGATEALSMLDGLAVLVVQMSFVVGDTIGLALTGDLTDAGTLGPEGVWFSPKEAAGTFLLAASIANMPVRLEPNVGVVAPAAAGGFFLIHGATKLEVQQILARVRRNFVTLLAARAERMEALVSGNHALYAGSPSRTKALLWMRLTGDQLVMKQMGTGIYAGLPWFNDYWGRDTFISITGILLVNGQYSEAAEVFTSFAALQDVDPNSKTYGRVPNRARPDGIEYNSADGTPRFIIALADLVRRCGDIALARRLWPVVKRAVEGVLKNSVDDLGLITHGDADTWMDAKEKGIRAWSPRGNRAIDVQALWAGAFRAVGELAYQAGFVRPVPHVPVERPPGPEDAFLGQLHRAGAKLEAALSDNFVSYDKGRLVDHLTPDGTKDVKLRPNALFALAQINPQAAPLGGNPMGLARQKMMWARQMWEGLVYPWGVATLSQEDPDFYPYHEHWNYYHKDAAYHNGTVWPWLNGVAMDALLGFNVIDQPWRLFENMNRQAFREGAVGSLAECADALPLPGANWTRRTGTFLQAWSNAEHLRVWQEGFLGLSVSAQVSSKPLIQVRPKLPKTVLNVTASMPIRGGCLHGTWHDGDPNKWSFRLSGVAASLAFELSDVEFGVMFCDIEAGGRVTFALEADVLVQRVYNAKGRKTDEKRTQTRAFSLLPTNDIVTDDQKRYVIAQEVFADLDFCKPRLQPGLKSLSVRHDPPLTY
jgi:glycogen debranching enzyme